MFLKETLFTAGVFQYKLDINADLEYSFEPEVFIINKFTLVSEHVMTHDLQLIRNDMGDTTFITFEKKFPFYKLA
jgi:hypothetical protein